MKTLIIKSLLPSLCQREEMYPSLAKRGEGRFFNNDALLMNSLVGMDFIEVWYERVYDRIYMSNNELPLASCEEFFN
ncbi:MAG: hypothetical protein AB1480_05945 [Nitrospirota bacterium]